MRLDGTGSLDPDGLIVAYHWEFGDGRFGTGSTPTHTYGVGGTYTVTLAVVDDDGASSTATTTVAISDDQPPISGVWTVRVPSHISPGEIEFQMEIEEFGGILWFDEAFPNGQLGFGIGMESDGIIFWFDNFGALLYGMVDPARGTMMGIVYNFMGDAEHNTIFLGQRSPP